jgi:hypothetical protein
VDDCQDGIPREVTFRAHLKSAKVDRARLEADTATEEPIDFRSLRDSYATWSALAGVGERVLPRRMAAQDSGGSRGARGRREPPRRIIRDRPGMQGVRRTERAAWCVREALPAGELRRAEVLRFRVRGAPRSSAGEWSRMAK